MSSGSKIINCKCPNSFQDATYGKHRRVANHADAKGNKKSRYRCTSCSSETDVKESGAAVAEKAK
jgi:transposase-like protein